jgi:16S rRNA processing protein RimM
MTEEYPYPADKYVLLGKITKAQGLRGEVKIYPFSGQPENFQGYRELVLVSKTGTVSPPMAVENVRTQGKTVIIKLSSLSNRNQAEAIEGRGVLFAKDLLPEPGDDEYYWYRYEDKLVKDLNGRDIGRVTSLFNNGAQDILVVKSGEEEILIPITKSIVVKETAEELTVDPPPGLLALYQEASDSR